MADVVVALFSAAHGEAGFVRKGELYEATHPTVKAHPDWFTDDLLEHAVRDPDAAARAEAEAAKAAKAKAKPKPDGE
jgi:hypothetical protein